VLRHCESEREIDQRSEGKRMELGRIRIGAPGEGKTAGAWPLHLAMVGACSCMEGTSWTRAARWGILPSTWRAAKRSAWDAILDRLQAEFGHGPKSKVAARIRLYISYLGCHAIRETD
jgi:hypothetical protein